jgi:hypothetical protein
MDREIKEVWCEGSFNFSLRYPHADSVSHCVYSAVQYVPPVGRVPTRPYPDNSLLRILYARTSLPLQLADSSLGTGTAKSLQLWLLLDRSTSSSDPLMKSTLRMIVLKEVVNLIIKT